jgi:hypothetical protein
MSSAGFGLSTFYLHWVVVYFMDGISNDFTFFSSLLHRQVSKEVQSRLLEITVSSIHSRP